MPVILLGNVAPVETAGRVTVTAADGSVRLDPGVEVVREINPLLGHTTTVVVPAEHDPERIAQELKNLWACHSSDFPGWVLTVDHPEGEAVETAVREALSIPAPTGPVALVTNGGLDFIATQLGGSASATAVGKFMALTANATAASASDTTLTSEITTASGGLIRATATYAHTTSASTYTISNTFTANGNDSLPVTIAKIGIFTASSSGTMVFETLLSATATISASGDTLAVTDTVTI